MTRNEVGSDTSSHLAWNLIVRTLHPLMNSVSWESSRLNHIKWIPWNESKWSYKMSPSNRRWFVSHFVGLGETKNKDAFPDFETCLHCSLFSPSDDMPAFNIDMDDDSQLTVMNPRKRVTRQLTEPEESTIVRDRDDEFQIMRHVILLLALLSSMFVVSQPQSIPLI